MKFKQCTFSFTRSDTSIYPAQIMPDSVRDADRQAALLMETYGFDLQAQIESLLRNSNKLLRSAASLRETGDDDARQKLWVAIAGAIDSMTKEGEVLKGTLTDARRTVPDSVTRRPKLAAPP